MMSERRPSPSQINGQQGSQFSQSNRNSQTNPSSVNYGNSQETDHLGKQVVKMLYSQMGMKNGMKNKMAETAAKLCLELQKDNITNDTHIVYVENEKIITIPLNESSLASNSFGAGKVIMDAGDEHKSSGQANPQSNNGNEEERVFVVHEKKLIFYPKKDAQGIIDAAKAKNSAAQNTENNRDKNGTSTQSCWITANTIMGSIPGPDKAGQIADKTKADKTKDDQEAAVKGIIEKLQGLNAVYIEFSPNHFCVVIPIAEDQVTILQGFQGAYDLADWFKWNNGRGREFDITKFQEKLTNLVVPGKNDSDTNQTGDENPWVATVQELFALDRPSKTEVVKNNVNYSVSSDQKDSSVEPQSLDATVQELFAPGDDSQIAKGSPDNTEGEGEKLKREVAEVAKNKVVNYFHTRPYIKSYTFKPLQQPGVTARRSGNPLSFGGITRFFRDNCCTIT